MGKLKRSSVIKNNQKKKNKKQAKLSIEELLEQAEDCLDQYELESAFQYAKRALDLDPKHIHALETMASIQMEMGNTESAQTIYSKLIELSPDEGFSKYMCLAQLSTGIEAVNLYNKGIELMLIEYNKQLNDSASTNQPSTSKQSIDEENEDENSMNKIEKTDISTAYCSIAELYLTDLCMEENAADLCKSNLDKSLHYDPKNPEALQLLASYWLSKENLDEAKKSILESLDIWLPKYMEAEEAGPLVDPSQAITLTYDSRINTSRILTEVQEFDKAVTVLEQLIDEDDEVVVVWYMLGWVNYCKGDEYYSNAKFYLKKAHELATKLKYDQKYLDDQLKAHILELLEQLKQVPSDDEEEEEDKEDKENLIGDDDDEEQFETDPEEEEVDENGNHVQNNKHINNGDLKAKNKATKTEEPMEFT